MKEVFEKTQCAQFDLCQVGHLCDPQSHKFVKKGLEVLTTSIKLYHKTSTVIHVLETMNIKELKVPSELEMKP